VTPFLLASGAEARLTNGVQSRTVVLVSGGQAPEVPGTWGASVEWLVRRLAPRFPGLGFVEVRYRVKSWRRLELCAEDAASALDEAAARGARSCVLVGFSMGGAVSALVAGHTAVRSVVGLAPWLPDQLPLDGLAGRRLVVLHGTLDRAVPGIPGVPPASSRRGFERARRAGVEDAEYTLIRGAGHAIALRAPWGLLPLPRAGRWVELLGAELCLFAAAESTPRGEVE
jgi:pimeloyl-ACP methyl ester carboxylesterase